MSKANATREDFLAALGDIYKITGADTDGNNRWHAPTDKHAIRYTLAAVAELRDDYQDAMDEMREM
jgi:hypothetical protein